MTEKLSSFLIYRGPETVAHVGCAGRASDLHFNAGPAKGSALRESVKT